jgi:hypothetical protein
MFSCVEKGQAMHNAMPFKGKQHSGMYIMPWAGEMPQRLL